MERPKRRRYRDNPYIIMTINNKYIIKFKDSKHIEQVIEVSKEVFDIFNESELKDLSQLNEYDRHIEHSEIFEDKLNARSVKKSILIDELIEKKEEQEILINAINSLTKVQKRRVIAYYFKNKKLREIAESEDCSIMSVKISLDSSIKKMQKILKNSKFTLNLCL